MTPATLRPCSGTSASSVEPQAAQLHRLLEQLVTLYMPHWDEIHHRHQCGYCKSRITKYKDLKRADLHGPGCVYIEAMIYLKKLATEPAEEKP